MTTDEARKIQAEVMRLAQTFRKRDGQPQLTSNNVHEAYFVMYNNLDTGYDKLSEWKRAVIRTSMSSSSGSMKKEFMRRYVDLAMRRDFLPDDEILEEAWGAGSGTLRSIRNRLRKRGFGFEGSVGKSIKITARPQPKPEPEPVKAPDRRAIEVDPILERVSKLLSNPSAVPSVDRSSPSPTDSDRLDTIIVLLRELLEVWTR